MNALEKKGIVEMIPIQNLKSGDILVLKYKPGAMIDGNALQAIANWLAGHQLQVQIVVCEERIDIATATDAEFQRLKVIMPRANAVVPSANSIAP